MKDIIFKNRNGTEVTQSYDPRLLGTWMKLERVILEDKVYFDKWKSMASMIMSLSDKKGVSPVDVPLCLQIKLLRSLFRVEEDMQILEINRSFVSLLSQLVQEQTTANGVGGTPEKKSLAQE